MFSSQNEKPGGERKENDEYLDADCLVVVIMGPLNMIWFS